ncbi:MAG TPA: sodium:proton antiporter NhaD [Gammaproteobacteria bacterium]|nr:sodium:proton antiporter NhaD [Gammaproteobacteria bacterium]
MKRLSAPVLALLLVFGLCPGLAAAAPHTPLDLTATPEGYLALALFVLAYLLVMAEEFTDLRKSKPVILAAGIIWGMIAYVYAQHGLPTQVEEALRHNLLEFAELFLFLLAAMTYVNAMDERLVFETLRARLISRGLGYRPLFWITGSLAFALSPFLDNLTTALVMCAVVLAVGKDSPRFVSLACINIVVGANAGGAFSPFGDITTLMVWQKGVVHFWTFFVLFLPAVVNFVVPASLMHFAVPRGLPGAGDEQVRIRRGGKVIIGLFACTVGTAVAYHNFLDLPPVLGMMTGLAYLQIYGYYLKMTHRAKPTDRPAYGEAGDMVPLGPDGDERFDVYRRLAMAEWDTLLFFYGVVLCVGGLGFIGYLTLVSQHLYVDMGPTFANVMVGMLSSIVDNIPVMYAVLTMHPDMSMGQWLLVTLTAGVGGSMLSIGSAAGVALMGQARGRYTFFSHLKWTPAIALGYAASILTHLWINAGQFSLPAGVLAN